MLEHRERFAENADTPVLLLEIARGNTQHPVRPVLSDRFLIGSSAACDLRLGGGRIPPLHSLIVRESDGRYRWERVAATAEMDCNGRPVESVILNDGDHVRIGSMEFVVRLQPGSVVRSVVAGIADESPNVEDPSELSANEIAERLEGDWSLVEKFEGRRRLGVETLLDAIAETAGRSESQASEQNTESVDLRRELERFAAQLNAFAGRLDANPEADPTDRNAIADTMNRVLDAQHRINGRIATLLHPDHPDAAAEPVENLNAA